MNTNIGDEEEMEKHLETPLTEKKVKELHAGDYVYISGTVYTARDAAHKRMIETLEKGESLPFDMQDQIIYYLGPTPEPRRTGNRFCRSYDKQPYGPLCTFFT